MSGHGDVDRELEALEPIFHRLPPRADRRAVEALIEPDFYEVGASGAVYTRSHVLDVVEQRYREGLDPDDAAWTVTDFHCHALTDRVYLVTYRLTLLERTSRRCTLWVRRGSTWRAAYHQGTICDPVGD
ncbi:nuclear transport factor 2 family protein [Gordonia bronchialis]|uniref:nuclear transport factor 2 family protein n=1 Tax=Gordonia bronchialis TaxID=2054 RepID=UPI00019B99FE|nr:DUF4440 domain-containing protein [Gordonia bronchialis]MCC3321565.1 DUF4440 domain-containing protein [Gordonia bronchialis]